MKDQNPEQERQVATEDPTASREQAHAQQQYERDQQDQQHQQGQQHQQDRQSEQQARPEFQSIERGNGSLIGNQEMDRFSSQWTSVQAAFVDDPKKAVEEADKLVQEVIQHLSQTFASERQKLEGQRSRGDSASTEDLRVALQRYRQFFQSLLRT